jgi:simple sugar transport system ATP-binding protein
MRQITKRFPGVLANSQVSLVVEAGEIHALLGENGAGKTTLMNVLYGLYQPESGQICVRDRPVQISSPRHAVDLGIGMVHQHFMLVPVLSAAENVILGLPPGKGPFLDLAAVKRRLAGLSAKSGLQIDPDAKVWQLPVGVQQRVEILKFLYRGTDILILDEPTAVLTPEEVIRFFDVLRALKAQGTTIILITHKLNEVMAVSDRVTVMRNGSVVTTLQTRETNPHELARLMVGREVLFRVDRPPFRPGRPVLELENLELLDDRGLPAVRGITLEIRTGEVLGLAGVSGNGQQELAEAVYGIRPVKSGAIKVGGRDLAGRDARAFIRAGVAQIPPDRREMGVVLDFTLGENAVLSQIGSSPYSKHGLLDWGRIRKFGQRLIEEYKVKCPGTETPARWLSGGNLQRFILAREITRAPKLLVAVQPTRGLDVAAIEDVHCRLMEERARGVAILLISTDLDEILALSDRIGVIYEGQIAGTLESAEADMERIALLMAGAG